MSLVWVNGTLVDKAVARVSPFDHGFLYGDGVWEPLRVFGGKLFRPADHLKRLYTNAGRFEIAIPHARDELTAAIEATVRANHRTDGYIRVIVCRGPGTLGPDPRKIDPQVFIIAEEYQPFPRELYGHGLHAALAGCWVDASDQAFWLNALGRTAVVSAKRLALRAGCLEAVLTDTGEYVIGGTEGVTFYVRGGVIYPAGDGRLDVAWETVHDLAPSVAPLRPADGATAADLLAADEVFIAGTSCGVIGIVRLDGTDIGSGTEGPVTRAVREAYRRLTRGDGPPPDTMPAEGGG